MMCVDWLRQNTILQTFIYSLHIIRYTLYIKYVF